MRNKQISVAAIVATVNRKELLHKHITQLLAQTRPLDEIIVVDNGSDDGTAEMLQAEFSSVTVIRFEENTGNVGGIASGLELAFEKDHDWFWVMDDDANAREDALEKLLNAAATLEGEKFCLYSCHIEPTGEYFSEPILILGEGQTKTFDRYEDAKKEGRLLQTLGGPYLGIFIPRSFCAAYGFPVREGFIGSDFEYIERMRLTGYKIFYVTDSIIHHRKYTVIYLKNPLYYLKLRRGTPKILSYPVTPDWRQYYAVRNEIYFKILNNKTYNRNRSALQVRIRALLRGFMNSLFAIQAAENKLAAIKFCFLGIWKDLEADHFLLAGQNRQWLGWLSH